MDALAAWKRAVEDPQLEDLPYKVETNEHGQLVLSPTSLSHSKYQSRIHDLLLGFLGADGRVFPELAVETSKGVKVPDVSWMSNDRLSTISEDAYAVPVAPELCVEVLSPRNTQGEMALKRALYFERGAHEVWVCDQSGAMHFYDAGSEMAASRMVPDFPRQMD